jgi:hypothetical protein
VSAPIHAETLRIRTTEVLRGALTRTTPAGLARVLGRNRSTTTRRRSTLKHFNGAELVLLAAYDGEFRDDLCAAWREQDETGEPLAAETDVRLLLRSAARSTDLMLDRLADGRLDDKEISESIPELVAIAAAATKALRDVRARQRAMRRWS